MAKNLVKRIIEKKKKVASGASKKSQKKTKGVKKAKKTEMTEKTIDPYKIIKFPLSTEKGVRLMEGENKLIFIVSKKATKQDIKAAIEQLFKAKVLAINTLNSTKGLKKAYVKFSPDTPAIDIATNLGLI